MNSVKPSTNATISNASAWVLRIGVVVSSLVMLLGITLTISRGHISVERIKSDGFDYQPTVIWNGILRGEGKRIIEAGIYLLLFTPIMRVFASILLFAFHEHDRLYALITLVVFLLTLAGLLWIG
jgi:uncharacterized membrane protein